ncbi:MAG: NAD+ synthase [Rhizobiales bacterium NRL2]|jgi:NAD+ synthase|nr:MAG: NAD+ synthase [Rhizobiales bacterium NRL2]
MPDTLRIALAQANPTVGDIAGNVALARMLRAEAAVAGADLIAFPEMFVTGYPPEDLLFQPAFQTAAIRAVEDLASETGDGGPAMLMTGCWRADGRLHNAAMMLDRGAVQATTFKHRLPNYGVFDEKRQFAEGPLPGPLSCRGVRLGVMLCEDMWSPDVAECLQETGAEILIVANGSPFDVTKPDLRINGAVARVTETGLPLLYLNLVGGQDELVFDGGSFALNADLRTPVRLPEFEPMLCVTDWRRNGEAWRCVPGTDIAPLGHVDAIYRTVMLGLRDFAEKNAFPGVVLGLSGGIDTALSAAIAVDAVGPERVWCTMLTSEATDADRRRNAEAVAALLGVRLDVCPIADSLSALNAALGPAFGEGQPDTVDRNLEARTRGSMLTALAERSGYLLLGTGNKSEISVGLDTLHEDEFADFGVLKDLYRTTVRALAEWRNANRPAGGLGPDGRVLPQSLIEMPAAARPSIAVGAGDLPAFDELDDMLECLIEGEMSARQVVERGHDAAVVRHVEYLFHRAEHRRRRTAPGVKVTTRSFGRDRRFPITNAFRETG